MTIIRRWARAAVPLLSVLTLVLSAPSLGAAPQKGKPAGAAASEAKARDVLYLRSGLVVEGTILEETATTVKMLVVVAGISAPTTYNKADILEIQRGAPAKDGAPGAPAEKPATEAPAPAPAAKPLNPAAPAPVAPTGDKPVVCLIELKGVIVGGGSRLQNLIDLNRRDIISYTPVKKSIEDALSQGPQLIIVKMECESPGGFDGMFIADPLYEIFEDAAGAGVKVVFWIKSAEAGAALLPFTSKHIYFTPDGVQGGIGDLGDFDIGDDLVNEKQISLRLGAAEGVAIRSGYAPELIRAMARKEFWLAVRWRGGKPEYIEHEPRPGIDGDGWAILSDDGEGQNKDEMAFEGNDVLNLDADMALKLLVSKGTYDKEDDLVFACGVRGEHDLLKDREDRFFTEWRNGVENAIDRFLDLQRDLERGDSGRAQSPGEALGRQKRILEEMRGILGRYAEVFDLDGAQRAQIDVQLEQIRQQILQAAEQDRQPQQGGNRRRGGGGGQPG